MIKDNQRHKKSKSRIGGGFRVEKPEILNREGNKNA